MNKFSMRWVKKDAKRGKKIRMTKEYVLIRIVKSLNAYSLIYNMRKSFYGSRRKCLKNS